MSTIQDRLLDRVRLELGDLEMPFDFTFATDGLRDHYRLEHRPIDIGTVALIKNGVEVPDPAYLQIYIDADTGILVFPDPPPAGEVWEVQGHKWRYFSDEDLSKFLTTAIAEHTYNRGDASGSDFTLGDVKPVEEYPIALRAVILALWALATDAAFDIDILAPDGVNIPRSERHRQLMAMIGARQTQYDELAHALNVGVNAIEVFTVRRVAKLTNRLVPVMLPQEYDDRSKAKRVLFPPMLQGTQPVATGIATYDWDIITGDPCGTTFDFAFDLTDCVIENAIRRGSIGSYPANVVGPPLREFTMEILDAVEGRVRLSLTGEETRWLPYNCYWELQITRAGETEPRTKMRGLVRATNNEVVR